MSDGNTYLRIPKQDIDNIQEYIREKKFIQAIKVVRQSTKCGLREAKHAIDRIRGKAVPHDAPHIRPLVELKSVHIDIGEGEICLDLNGLQLTLLTNMEKIGIDTTRRLIELYDMLIEWQGSLNTNKTSGTEDDS